MSEREIYMPCPRCGKHTFSFSTERGDYRCFSCGCESETSEPKAAPIT